MSADVAARIAADKATTVAATEPSDAGGWLVERGPIQWEVFSGKESATSEDIAMAIHHKADAEFIAAARTRWPLYVAAIEAVTALVDASEQVLWPAANGYPAGWSLNPDDVRRALAVLAPSTEETK